MILKETFFLAALVLLVLVMTGQAQPINEVENQIALEKLSPGEGGGYRFD